MRVHMAESWDRCELCSCFVDSQNLLWECFSALHEFPSHAEALPDSTQNVTSIHALLSRWWKTRKSSNETIKFSEALKMLTPARTETWTCIVNANDAGDREYMSMIYLSAWIDCMFMRATERERDGKGSSSRARDNNVKHRIIQSKLWATLLTYPLSRHLNEIRRNSGNSLSRDNLRTISCKKNWLHHMSFMFWSSLVERSKKDENFFFFFLLIRCLYDMMKEFFMNLFYFLCCCWAFSIQPRKEKQYPDHH